jgi:hypothetical protein
MKMSSRRIAGLVRGKLVTLSAAVAPAPAGSRTHRADQPNLGEMARPETPRPARPAVLVPRGLRWRARRGG